MSNVLCPIAARYSLFFTLALFDSSILARSKHPREVALGMVQRAQEQFQEYRHANAAAKSKALIRTVSAVSSSSTSSSSSSYPSSHQSQSSSSTTPTNTSSSELSSFPKSVDTLLTATHLDVTSTRPISNGSLDTTLASTSPSSRSSISSAPTVFISSLALTCPSPKSLKKNIRANRTSKSSVAITTLLSISITIILLSLLQSRSRYRHQQQHYQQRGIVSQRSHNNSRQHSRRRRPQQQQQLVSTDCPSTLHTPLSSSLLTQLNEYHYKGDSATCIPDKIKNTSSCIKTINSPANPLSSPFLFTSASKSVLAHTTIMDTNTVSVSTPPSNKQLRNDYVTAWLNHQAMDDDHCYRFDTNQIEDDQYTTFPEQQESQLNILPHQNANTTSPSRISYHHHLPQANHSSATIMRAFLAQGHGNGHRRCLSLTNPMTMSVTPTQTISYEEQLRQQLEWRRQNYQLLHANTATTTLSTAAISSRYPDTHLFSDGLVSYWPPQKTAEELAWERHNYYLRLQVEEEELIEKLQSDRKQGRGHRAQHKKLNQLWKPQPEPSPSVARTSSLNRLSGPSLLSAETSRVLGLCRTSTLSAVKKISFSKKDTFSRTSRPASPSFGYSSKSASNVVDDDSILTQGLEVYSYGHTTITTSNMTTGTTSSSPSLSLGTSSSSSSPPSKNLIKDHLGPSLKSLARRCSTRFYRRSRSNSDAYPTSDITDDYPLGRRSLGSYPSQQKQRSHLYDFKQVPTGPTSGSTELPMQEGRHRRSMTNERVPIHRTVTMTRSKSTRTPTSATMAKKDNGHHPAPISTVLELPYRPHRNSLRFANGRGLEFSRTPSLTTASSSSSQSTRSSVDLKGSAVTPGHNDEKGLIPIITTTLVDADSSIVISSVVPTSVLDPEEHESMRQQIVAILSLDRNDMRRRPSSRPRSRSATPGLDRPQQTDQHIDQHQQEHLSPLAVEAQDILPVDPKTTQKEQEVAAELADPCGHIAFMLVPKSQYEFQPLVAH